MNLNLMYSIDADNYVVNIKALLGIILKSLDRVCYICLDKSGQSVYEFCKENDVDLEKVVIVDMVSSRFMGCKSKGDIIYLPTGNLDRELKLIVKTIRSKKCSTIIFDSLSTLQVYYGEKESLRFAHELLVFTESEHIITNLIIRKTDLAKEWVKSLTPLVGTVRDVTSSLIK